MAKNVETTSGVQELIDTLIHQGVTEGQTQAGQMIQQAQVQAARIIESAQAEADKLCAQAKQQIEMERASAHESIRLAFRDTELNLRSKFREAFSNYLRKLVSYELQDKEFIKQVVLSIAKTKAPLLEQSSQIEIQLPVKLLESEGNRMQFTEEGKKQLGHLLLGTTTEMLREGVQFRLSEKLEGGIHVRLLGEDMEIDLSDDAISDMLLQYLLPRYRAIVSGQE